MLRVLWVAPQPIPFLILANVKTAGRDEPEENNCSDPNIRRHGAVTGRGSTSGSQPGPHHVRRRILSKEHLWLLDQYSSITVLSCIESISNGHAARPHPCSLDQVEIKSLSGVRPMFQGSYECSCKIRNTS
jgi:hypothetical protein